MHRRGYLVIVLLAFACSLRPALGGNELASFSADGTKYTMQFVSTTTSADGLIVLLGEGVTFVDKGILAMSYPIVEMSKSSIQLKTSDGVLTLEMTPQTQFCSKGKKVKAEHFKAGDAVFVTCTTEQKVALSVQSGPLPFGLSNIGAEPIYKACPK